jgi:DNA-binding NarL/FixJ family response regulator
MVKVILISPRSITGTGVKLILDSAADIQLVGETDSMSEALVLIPEEKPDLLLIKTDHKGGDLLKMIDGIVAISPDLCVLILAGTGDVEHYETAILAGAKGVVFEHETADTLLLAIRKVCDGETWIDRALTSKLLKQAQKQNSDDQDGADKLSSLTARELEVIELIVEGLVNNDIAERLFISPKTVRNHLTSIYGKLELTGRLKLAIYASRHGIKNYAGTHR